MTSDRIFKSAIAGLEASDQISIDRQEVRYSAEEEIAFLGKYDVVLPPDELLDFYRSMNGVTLLWSGRELSGSLNILQVMQSALRGPLEGEGEPLEEILWTQDTPEPEQGRLRKMSIFESVAGRDDFLTYDASESSEQFYFVSNWKIQIVKPNWTQTINLLLTYAGADPIREYILHDDWEKRIAEDSLLQGIFGEA